MRFANIIAVISLYFALSLGGTLNDGGAALQETSVDIPEIDNTLEQTTTNDVLTVESEDPRAPECSNYTLLNESNRAMTYNLSRPLICDSGLSGWYRFGGQAGNQMPESCVDKLRCGTHAPGWLNGSHPSVGEGAVRRKVCFHWGNQCCHWSSFISVRNCGRFFVYELHRPPACTLRYCGNGVPSSPECSNYTILDEFDRAQGYRGGGKCDNFLTKGWYRFQGRAGKKMPEQCVATHRCGTAAPGYLNGRHPTVAEGIVSRRVCFHWSSNCCRWSRSIRVRNCNGFYVYELDSAPVCSLRYCGDAGIAPTTSMPTPTPTPTSNSECSNYRLLNEADRAMTYNQSRPLICDRGLSGWYRFGGQAGNQMPESCVDKLRCGTHAPGWLNGSHPSVGEGAVRRKVCFHWGNRCCHWSSFIRVRNCGRFFVYELHQPPACTLRYCGNGVPSSPECSNYTILDEFDRAQGYRGGGKCDNLLTKGWYRFQGKAGKKMPEQCVATHRCGTAAPGYLNGRHPTVAEGIVSRRVCFHWSSNCCRWSRSIRVRNCNGFYVYELDSAPVCSLRYCGDAGIAPTTSIPTPTPTPTSNSECSNYRLLNEADRAMTYNQSRPLICDRGLSGWYRFGGQAGNQMPESCVDKLRCGTHAPGWLNGSHPSVGEGAVRRKVCFHWGNRCCHWSSFIRVRNCGRFFVYELHQPPACTLRYCGNGVPSSPAPTTARLTPTPTPTSNSECFSYRYLKEPDRAMTYNGSRPLICDSGLSGWYRFGGQAGNQMPESCVDKLRCGTHAPGWLNGSHPSSFEGTVRRKVCFHWGNRCCRWSTYISVRNCGGFFIYKLHRPPACTLRYCGNGLGSTPTPPTTPPSTRANHGFFIFCLPNAMLVNIPRNRLPLQADPGLLHLNDPGCGVLRYDEKTVMLRTPLEGCGTVRRLIGAKVSYYNNVVMPSTNKRSLLQFPFKCAYNRFGLPGKGNTPKPVANHDEVIDSDTTEGTL